MYFYAIGAQGILCPYEGSIGGTLSYHFTLTTPLPSNVIDGDSFGGNAYVQGLSPEQTLVVRDSTNEERASCMISSFRRGEDDDVLKYYDLTEEDIKSISNWLTDNSIDKTTTPITFVFAPTSLGIVRKIRVPDGREFDFSDYDDW